MIVKNEEAWLGAILEDCRHFADEIVVCDTGSTDGTIDIIKKAGCKLVHFPWTGSYSDARNYSLKHCSGHYILWVDADDRIPRSQQLRFRWLKRDYLSKRENCAYLVNLVSDDGRGGELMDQLRIFPKVSDDMWYGRVHESVSPTVTKEKIGLKMANVYIYHEGYTDNELLMAKIRRNVELLDMDIDETGNAIKESYMGISMANLGDHDKALEHFEKSYLSEDMKHHNGQRFLLLMRMYSSLMKKGELVACMQAMEEAKTLFPDDPQPFAVQAMCCMLKGKVHMAREYAAEAIRRKHDGEAGLSVIHDVHGRMKLLLEETKDYVYQRAEDETEAMLTSSA